MSISDRSKCTSVWIRHVEQEDWWLIFKTLKKTKKQSVQYAVSPLMILVILDVTAYADSCQDRDGGQRDDSDGSKLVEVTAKVLDKV